MLSHPRMKAILIALCVVLSLAIVGMLALIFSSALKKDEPSSISSVSMPSSVPSSVPVSSSSSVPSSSESVPEVREVISWRSLWPLDDLRHGR